MHAVHPVKSWTFLILTPRLGEAHGLRVADLEFWSMEPGAGCCCTAKTARRSTSMTVNRVVRTNLTEGRNHGYSERMQLVRLC